MHHQLHLNLKFMENDGQQFTYSSAPNHSLASTAQIVPYVTTAPLPLQSISPSIAAFPSRIKDINSAPKVPDTTSIVVLNQIAVHFRSPKESVEDKY